MEGSERDELFTSAEMARRCFEQSRLAQMIVGMDFRVRECNEALLSFLGSTRGRLIGLDVRTVRDQRIVPSIVAAHAGEAGVYRGPYDATSGAAHVHLDAFWSPIRDASGVQQGILGTLVDSSIRGGIEHELRDQLDLVERQAATIRALGSPILRVWKGVLCLPVIGVVDSERAARMTDALLDAIVAESARYAIVDLTGVEVLDTATAQHLLRLFRAAQLVGTEGILCGLRPAVAQTVVTLEVEMGAMHTKRTLFEALEHCLTGRRL
jgi:rsbT co-antagonist protein RsbR